MLFGLWSRSPEEQLLHAHAAQHAAAAQAAAVGAPQMLSLRGEQLHDIGLRFW